MRFSLGYGRRAQRRVQKCALSGTPVYCVLARLNVIKNRDTTLCKDALSHWDTEGVHRVVYKNEHAVGDTSE